MSAPRLHLWVDSGDELDVSHLQVDEGLDRMFSIDVLATSTDADLALDPVVGEPARVTIEGPGGARHWTGIVAEAELVHASQGDASTYRFHVVPPLWLLGQRSNYRIYQYQSEIEIALGLLEEWDIHPLVELDVASYPKRKYRVQYGESDLAFLYRMLQDAGISFWFAAKGDHTYLVLGDDPASHAPREPLAARDDTGMAADAEWARGFARGIEVRPGSYRVKDVDLRLPADLALLAEAELPSGKDSIEGPIEVFEFEPGFMQVVAKGGDTPTADDRGAARTDEAFGVRLARRRLEALRATRDVVAFESNALDLAPSVVVPLFGATGPELPGDGADALLIVASRVEASPGTATRLFLSGVSTRVPWRPARTTTKAVAAGVESATVVGPAGEEIYTDEMGRVRVTFHWDRETKYDATSSCWLPVSQPWAGGGYGGVNVPRVGQEVLVDFEGGDPDRPVVSGRVYTRTTAVPYRLPESATESGWRSNSTRGRSGFNEIRWQDRGGQELFSVQAERDLNERVLHDDAHSIGVSRGITVQGNETLDVQSGRSVYVHGRIDEATYGTDDTHSETSVDISSNTTIFLEALLGMAHYSDDTMVLAGNEVAFDCETQISLIGDSSKAEIMGPSAAAGGGLIALLAQMLDINPGATSEGDRPLTEAESESDRLWEQELRAEYDTYTDEGLERALHGRSYGAFAVPDIPRPGLIDRLSPSDEAARRQRAFRQGAIDALMGIAASEREYAVGRPIAPDVRNRYPRPAELHRPGELLRGSRRSEKR